MKKYIIGLGCSWTQGEGGYPEQVWKDHGGRVQVRCRPDYYLRHIEHENSWVNVLCRDHFTDFTPINLGVRGIGNIAAVQQLYFADKVDFNNSSGIIVLLLSGFERLDFFNQNPKADNTNEDDFYSFNEYRHYKWRTAWPFAGHGDVEEPLWAVYGKMLHSDQFVANNQMMSLLHLQSFAKAYNFKIVVANAFNCPEGNGVTNFLQKYVGNTLYNKFDWSTYLHNTTDYISFVQKLVELDGLMEKEHWMGFYNFYKVRNWPAKYLTNCDGAHPTLDGYKIIAEELAKFIKTKNYV